VHRILHAYAAERPVVVALPRGGVPVACEIARALRAPLDIWVVRKLGVPWYPELGVGAVAEGGFIEVSPERVSYSGVSPEELVAVIEKKRREVDATVRALRGDRPRPVLQGRTVILVDDGIATGGTVRAAIQAIRAEQPKQIVLAVPVAAPETIAALDPEVDRIVCLLAPAALRSVGQWYESFEQIPDDQVVRLLERAGAGQTEGDRAEEEERADARA
jgi:putative phosphoribosyl transferase